MRSSSEVSGPFKLVVVSIRGVRPDVRSAHAGLEAAEARRDQALMDAAELAELRETEEQHGHYEPTAPNHHCWDW